MRSLSFPAALSVLECAYAFQIPFLSAPYKHATELSVTPTTQVSSDALQQLINPDNLYKRAEQLFKIAESSIDEYGHPTRVIGSEGAPYSFYSPLLHHISGIEL